MQRLSGTRASVLIDSESEPGEGSSRGLLRDCETSMFAMVRFKPQMPAVSPGGGDALLLTGVSTEPEL